MAFSYRPQTLHDTIHTVLPGEVLPAIPGYSESSRNLFATYIPLRQRKIVSDILRRFFRYDPVPAPIDQLDNIRWKRSHRHSPTRIHALPDICPCYKTPVHDIPLFFVFSAHPACPRCKACTMLHFPCCHKHLEFFY